MAKVTDMDVRECKAKFAAAHEDRYGKRVLKTAWHFLHWAVGYDGALASRRLSLFERWCAKYDKPRTTDNAVRWYLAHKW